MIPGFIVAPTFGHGAGTLLSAFFHTAVHSDPKSRTEIMILSKEDNEDDEYVDPTPEEMLDWIYADEDSRPEEDQYGDC
jgi:hypothetical protein